MAALLATSGSAAADEVQPPQVPPDYLPGDGIINGRTALGFVAYSRDGKLLGPEGFDVHLVPVTELDRELTYPVGSWFQPPKGRYRVWLEGSGLMTPATSILSYSGHVGQERGLVGGMPLHPAGTVSLEPGADLPGAPILRLIHTTSHNFGSYAGWEMTRRATGDARFAGVQMPEGPVVAALNDPDSGEILALTRPVEVSANGTTRVRPKPPAADRSHLLVVLERPTLVDRVQDFQEQLLLKVGQESRGPDVIIPATRRIYAIWYDLAERQATLEVESPKVHLDPQPIRLRPGRIDRFDATLQARPALDVRLDLPDLLRNQLEDLKIRVLVPAGASAAPVERTVPSSAHETRFEDLPPGEVEVELSADIWSFRQTTRLVPGEDGQVVFRPEPIFVSGRVFRGDEPHPARVSFSYGRDRDLEVETDDEGFYEAVTFRPIFVVAVFLDGAAGPPFLDMLNDPVRQTSVLDLVVPASDFRVTVLDASTGQPIPNAWVGSRNETLGGKTVQQAALADEEGVASLPPLRPGQLKLTASADGYEALNEPVVQEIVEDGHTGETTLQLQPLGAHARLRVLLSDGRPGDGARVALVDALQASSFRWQDEVDSSGEVAVPRRLEGALLLVRHPRAGFLVQPWRAPKDGEVSTLTLPVATAPLQIQTTDASEASVPNASLRLLTESGPLAGPVLGWLTDSRAATGRDGSWTGTGLPPAAVEVLAYGYRSRNEAAAGLLDAMAAPVPYPWTDPVAVIVVE